MSALQKHCYNCVHVNSPAVKCIGCSGYSNWVFNEHYNDGIWVNGKWVQNKGGK